MLTSFGYCEGQPASNVYTSTRQAYEAFEKSADPSSRLAAYEWMKTKALKCGRFEIGEAFSLLGKMAVKLERDADFEKACEMRAQMNNAELTAVVSSQLADWYSAKGDDEKALKTLTVLLVPEKGLAPSQTAVIATKAASILANKMSRHADASKLIAEVITSVSTNDPSAFATLANAQSGILRNNLSDAKAAEALTREVLALGDSCPGTAYAIAAEQLASMLREKGDVEGAVGAMMLMLKHESLPNAGIARKILDIGAKPSDIEEGLRLLRLRTAAYPSDLNEFRAGVERIQPEIIEFLAALGRREEAVRECRVFVFTASDKSYPLAIEMAAKTFKSLDGNLGKANALLEFQSSDDEVIRKKGNVLMNFPMLDDPVRTESFKAPALAEKPTDWSGWLLRSAYLLWLDRPSDSMDAATEAFSICPLSDTALQTCAAATVRPLLVATRDSAAAQTVIDYLLLGAPGRDGVIGTSDDMQDPLPEVRRKLAFPEKSNVVSGL
jgi:hypothetical protein